jgi:hypothetical protein
VCAIIDLQYPLAFRHRLGSPENYEVDELLIICSSVHWSRNEIPWTRFELLDRSPRE